MSPPAGASAAEGRAGIRPSAVRTANVETPHSAATAACDFPAAASSLIFSVSSGVSFDGPFGPRRAGSSPASPSRRYASAHRHTVTGPAPNAAAACFCVAAPISVSCTAASRRPASSPAAQQNVIIPCTHTAPPPSGNDTSPTPGAISAASAGNHGSGAWASLAAIPASPGRPPILHELYRQFGPDTAGNTRKDSKKAQARHLVTPRQQTAMSGVLRPGR